MKIRILVTLTIALLGLIAGPAQASNPNLSGSIRGVQFEYLDGSEYDIQWILENLDPASPNAQDTTAKIDNLLTAYENSGVNYIRVLMIGAEFDAYCQAEQARAVRSNNPIPIPSYSYCNNYTGYPGMNAELISDANQFIALINGNQFAGKFKLEMFLQPMQVTNTTLGQNGYFCESYGNGNPGDTTSADFNSACPTDSTPDATAIAFYNNWISNVIEHGNNAAVVGITMFAGGAFNCSFAGCDGAPNAIDPSVKIYPLVVNNGEFVKHISLWMQQNHPELLANYESVGIWSDDPNGVDAQIQKVVPWVAANTPNVPYVDAALYVREAPGAGPLAYAADANKVLTGFVNASAQVGLKIPLWIDEYGGVWGTDTSGSVFTEQDQHDAVDGFLAASVCGVGLKQGIPKFLWVAGDDENPNYPTNPRYGLVESFDDLDTPSMALGWAALSDWYTDTNSVSTPATGIAYTLHGTSLDGTLSPCGTGNASFAFSVVTAPAHGTVTITNPTTGAFTYTPKPNFTGQDSFTFQNGQLQSAATENITVFSYSPAQITAIILGQTQ